MIDVRAEPGLGTLASRLRYVLQRLLQLGWAYGERLLVERRYDLPASFDMSAGDHDALAPGRNAYAPTPWRLLRKMLPAEDVGVDDVFVDLGCGKGRILLQAAQLYHARQVIGVEVEPRLAGAARLVLERNEALLRVKDWSVVTTDVLDYEIPEYATIVYLYDPFTGPIFDAVISKLEDSVNRAPRRVRIVYLTPGEITRLRRSGRVVPVRQGITGWLTTGGRWQYFVGDLMPSSPTLQSDQAEQNG